MDPTRDDNPLAGFKSGDPEQPDRETVQRECAKHGAYAAERRKYGWRWMPWSGCEACAVEAEERERAQAAQRAEREELQRRRELLSESGLLGTRFEVASFDTYQPATPRQRAALKAAQRYAAEVTPNSAGALVLIGPPGVGKTHLAAAALLHVIGARGLSGCLVGARQYVRKVRETWGGNGSESDVLRDHALPVLLVLDDLGTGAGTPNEQALLLDLVDARYQRRRPVVLTSNLTRPELRAALDERVWDRLQHDAVFVSVDGESHRRPAA